jgi:twitching motility protein PilT
MDIFPLINLAASRGASDLHLVAESPPLLRVHGMLEPADSLRPITSGDIDAAFTQLTSDGEKEDFQRYLELDFGYTLPDVLHGIGRLRCNAARQRDSTSLVIRLMPMAIPSLDELGMPEVCKGLALKPRGLVIVGGPTGSGKSTTLAGMIEYLNNTVNRRIVTIEDPIEYIYTNKQCTITQRELGSDTHSFAEALKHVVRQDPDVILVGETRDLETAAAVLAVAETGHLVLTTGHAPSTSQAVERIVDLFPPHERHLAQSRLASLLLGILCQTLVPKAYEAGRVAAVEVMLASPAVRNLIRESKLFQIPNTIRTQVHQGMELLDQSLVKLYRSKIISSESMFAFCHDEYEVSQLSGKAS